MKFWDVLAARLAHTAAAGEGRTLLRANAITAAEHQGLAVVVARCATTAKIVLHAIKDLLLSHVVRHRVRRYCMPSQLQSPNDLLLLSQFATPAKIVFSRW